MSAAAESRPDQSRAIPYWWCASAFRGSSAMARRSASCTPANVRGCRKLSRKPRAFAGVRSEEHTSELQSLAYLVCRLLLEKKKKNSLLSSHKPYEAHTRASAQ